jgi:hypothetical protein
VPNWSCAPSSRSWGETRTLRGCTHGRRVRIGETIEAIKAVGAEHFILGIDLGQTGNPSHADGLQMFVTDLLGRGLRGWSLANDERIVPSFGSEAEDALSG